MALQQTWLMPLTWIFQFFVITLLIKGQQFDNEATDLNHLWNAHWLPGSVMALSLLLFLAKNSGGRQ